MATIKVKDAKRLEDRKGKQTTEDYRKHLENRFNISSNKKSNKGCK